MGYIFFQGSWAWHVKMPSNIKGLVGSCLVIPCTFDYYRDPPRRPNRMVWYRYVKHGYPIVYDDWYPNDVIGIYKRKTCVFTSIGNTTHFSNCLYKSLLQMFPLFTGNMLSRGWSFTTPGIITAMRGSCIIIPCTFTYSISQPADLRVVWYLYQSNGYPPVFDDRENIISKFNSITRVIGSVGERNCSLKIEKLDMSHNQDRLYPWIDKNPITSYHTLGQTFYEKTSFRIFIDHAQEPQLSIIGIPRVGEESTVSCNVQHACISAPPILTLNGIPGKDIIKDNLVSDGIWERTAERTWAVKEEGQSVTCTVSHRGGQKATSELKLNVECPYEEIKMTEWPSEATESVTKNVICVVSYKCKKNKPSIVWNYEDMQSLFKTKEISSNTYEAVSNLTFTARFIPGETSDSETLQIKRS
ncbi:B-cell receptor CD22-like [Cottoperca gobio]|uniref:B-cell receptor CD22-like n=1 Tax=Cottoperca gobio TaxID=56716 RepID=A0A6J2R9T4_COTGO|nr:B-cell receptor CD22-like [Cottoperca gobio]